jgi:hypothetical protein
VSAQSAQFWLHRTLMSIKERCGHAWACLLAMLAVSATFVWQNRACAALMDRNRDPLCCHRNALQVLLAGGRKLLSGGPVKVVVQVSPHHACLQHLQPFWPVWRSPCDTADSNKCISRPPLLSTMAWCLHRCCFVSRQEKGRIIVNKKVVVDLKKIVAKIKPNKVGLCCQPVHLRQAQLLHCSRPCAYECQDSGD